jgi:AraC-like DNA-binding protein
MSGPATASIRTVQALFAAATSLGADRAELLEAAGIDLDFLAQIDGRVPIKQLSHIWLEASRLSGDPHFGLRAAMNVPAGAFGVVEFAASRNLTLEAAYRQFTRYARLLVDGVNVELRVDGDNAVLTYHRSPEVPPFRHMLEYTLALCYLIGRRLARRPWKPTLVTFAHQAPPDTSLHEEVFDSPVVFDRDNASIIFDREYLRLPLADADPMMLAILENRLDMMLTELPDLPVSSKVRRVVSSLLSSGESPRLEEAAKALGVSARTLQRRLRDEGNNYHDVIEDLRRDMAVGYLGVEELAICDVAYLLGFSEPSAFHRAFRRWMGMTPAEYRHGAP